MATEAGTGEHHVYKIVPNADPNAVKLTPRLHYLGVDAVAWFINRQSSWFTDRMASGTLEITLSSGLETYHSALGTFELKGGAKTAPVFDAPMLPDRNFVGGPISFNASLTAIKKDTVVAGMLKSAAAASLGIVAGMVQTASATGPAKLLSAAGEELVNGVKKVLSDTGQKREPLFDFSGLKYAMQPNLVVGNEIFLLLHRGAPLDETQLTVKQTGQLLLPRLGTAILDDGAWLLLRLRRSDEYTGVREWYSTARALREKIKSLVSDFEAEVVRKADALKQLKPSGTGNTTIFDDFTRLRTLIQNDGVLSERQAGVFVGDLNAAITAARKSISGGQTADTFTVKLGELNAGLSKGQPPKDSITTAFIDGIDSVAKARRPSHKRSTIKLDQLVATVRYMPKTLTFLHGGGQLM